MRKMLIALFAVAACGVFAADYKPMAENSLVTVKAVTGATTLTAAESGQVILVTGAATEVTLPTAAAGLNYTIVRGSASAGDDVIVTAGSGDKIDGGSAAGSITNDVDQVGLAFQIIAVNATDWVVSGSKTDL